MVDHNFSCPNDCSYFLTRWRKQQKLFPSLCSLFFTSYAQYTWWKRQSCDIETFSKLKYVVRLHNPLCAFADCPFPHYGGNTLSVQPSYKSMFMCAHNRKKPNNTGLSLTLRRTRTGAQRRETVVCLEGSSPSCAKC